MTTWNPADKDAAIALSGANLIATQNSATGAWRSVRATTGKITGKWYFELTPTANDGIGGIIAGLANASANLADLAGADAYGCGFQTQGSAYGFSVVINGSVWGSVGTAVGIAVDFGAGDVWMFNGSTWNQGAGNPAAGTGGNTMAGTVNDGIAVFPIFSGFRGGGSADGVSINTGGSAFDYTVPAGFTGWDLTPVAPVLGAGSMMLMGIGS